MLINFLMQNFFEISASHIQQHSRHFHEPRWMCERRMRAFEFLVKSEVPDFKKNKIPEIPFQQLAFHFSAHMKKEIPIKKNPPKGYSGKIVMKDQTVKSIALAQKYLEQGVLVLDMRSALLERADLLEAYLSHSSWRDFYSSLSDAFFENGYLIYIPEGVHLEEPFQVEVTQHTSETRFSQFNFIIEKGSSLMVEEFLRSTSSRGTSKSHEPTILRGSNTNIFLEENAKLQLLSVQDYSSEVYDLSTKRVTVKKNAHAKLFHTIVGGKCGRVEIVGVAKEEGANIEHNGIVLEEKKQRFTILPIMYHSSPHTEGMMKYKGIFKDESSCFFHGLIHVDPGAVKSVSRLEEHSILLGEKARSDALPALDIRQNDVSISHAASVSKEDPEKIFYLMSRGLSGEEAKKLLTEGFLENLLSSLTHPKWYAMAREIIESKLA